MASGLFSSIQSLSSKLLEAIRGTPSTSHQQHDPASPDTDQNKSVRKDLEKLSRMLVRIQAVQQDAEEREIHDCSVRLWLEELRGVSYKAEDVLDEFYYEVLRSIVESGDAAIEAYHRDGGNKRKFAEMYTSPSLASYPVTITKVSIPDGMAEKIKDITERFEEIVNARRDLHLREEDGTRLVMGPQIRPPTSSHVDERATFGREKEKEDIISLLDPSNGPDFMVLPIVGMGGLGKTTLAQLVFNDTRIHGLFNKRCWVSVSEDFDLVRLTKSVVDSLSANCESKSIVDLMSENNEEPCEFSELNILQNILMEKIRDDGLFLVLDDVWNEKKNRWECFRVGFLGAKFVRILMTTRNTSVAKIMQTASPYQLRSLPESNCLSLFKHFAFGNRETSENANLHEIGCGIAKKCNGSPLAIKALGGICCYEMDEEKWREILESDISEIDETGEVMPVLRLSYLKLPQYLKPCFLYLSMFPKDTSFEKDMVIRLWMAQGYIKGNIRTLKTLEDIGSEYFDELQGRSLIDCGPEFSSYLLHDLIHDLARSISHEAYQPVFENDQQCIGICKVYHMYLTKEDKLLGYFFSPSNYCSIRTFVNKWPEQNFDFAFSYEFAYVRVLELGFSLLPNKLSMLKHLRYLSIGNRHMETLPETFCVLYNLQTLDLYCSNLRELPENIKNLLNLRYLYIGDNSQMKMLPETLCLLYNLQTLNLNCSKLRELPENIKNLIDLRYIQLRSTEIQQLPESIFMLHNLHTLSLKYCQKLKELPRGIEQLTRLRKLKLPESLIYMPFGIGKLTTLKPLSGYFSVMNHDVNGGLGELKDMNKLSGMVCISGLSYISNGEYSRNANLASKPNLHKLILNFQEDGIRTCEFIDHLHLTVSSSKNTNNENDEKMQEVVLQSLQPHGNLTELAILNYGGRIFPSWLLNSLLPKLTTLTLNFWTEPNFLPPFGQLPHLRFLDISGNAGVRNVGDELNTYSLLAEYGSSKQPREPSYPSLEVFSLRNMLNLVEWQIHDSDFPCLKQLTIENCPKLWKISTIPQKVREITFAYCSKLELLTCPSRIKKVDIHECGFRKIMFGSVSDNLTISNCVELTSIYWREGGLYTLREVRFEYCPKLVLTTIPIGTMKLKIHECGFHEIMFGSVSENLTISNCKELISINWSEGALNSVREVTFEYCPKLQLITIPVSTLKLKMHECGSREIIFQSISENLTISNCVELISVKWMKIFLKSVREVSFEYCPKLELVFIPAKMLKLRIHECGFRKIIFWSISENLIVSNCVELTLINWRDRGLITVGEVTFENCPKLELVIIPVGTLNLKIHECGFREIIFRNVCVNLTISNCVELISIKWGDGRLIYVKNASFQYCPKLKLPIIPTGIKKLKIAYCGIQEIIFPLQSSIQMVDIFHCSVLTSIHWVTRETLFHTNLLFKVFPELQKGLKFVQISHCPILQFPVKDVLHSMMQRAEIYACPRMDLGERYIYQRDTMTRELNLFGNKEIHLPSVNSRIPLLENHFTLFLTKEDFQEVESLTCTPSVGVSCQHVILNLASLLVLDISRCRKVISVTGLDNLSNLKCVCISYCPELCNWNDKTLPLSLKFLELDSCDKLSSLPLLSDQNHLSTLKVLVIKKCPRLAVMEGFHGLVKLKIVELLHCRNISITPATETLQFRPHIMIGDCPLMRDWCRRNWIIYYDVKLIDNPHDDKAKLESAEQESAKWESGEQSRAESTSIRNLDSEVLDDMAVE